MLERMRGSVRRQDKGDPGVHKGGLQADSSCKTALTHQGEQLHRREAVCTKDTVSCWKNQADTCT